MVMEIFSLEFCHFFCQMATRVGRTFATLFVQIPTRDFLTLEFCYFIHSNQCARFSHVGVLLLCSFKSRRKIFSRWSFATLFVQTPTQDFLTLDFCYFVRSNPDSRFSHVGVLLICSFKFRRKILSRWTFSTLFVQSPTQDFLTLEFC